MVCFCIENRYGDVVARRYNHESVFDYLSDREELDLFDAIEASSWCELACVGEVYQGDGFRISVEEE